MELRKETHSRISSGGGTNSTQKLWKEDAID